MICFMADVLIPKDMSVDLDLISEVVFLVIDFWIIVFMLGCEVWRKDSGHQPSAIERYARKLTYVPYHRVASLGLHHYGQL